MASSLAAQLSQIASTSSHQLDLKAQRVAHSQSLIFEKKVAASQSFDTIYQISYEGFQELCALDSRFSRFQRNIFSEQSRTEDRLEMTEGQNKELDRVLEDFLALVGARLLLTPAVKAVDWLVRRFRVHEHNTSFLIFTFLPYHTTPLFLNLLSILPETFAPTFKILFPYRRSLTNPPRQAIVQGAATNKHLFSALNDYVLQASKGQAQYQGLVSFWAGITTEALAIMLESARSGRIEIEKRNMEDVLLRVLPVLHAGFALKKAPDVVMGCYMICVVMANKGSLEDTVLDGIMEVVAGTWTQDTSTSGLICLAALAERKDNIGLPNKVIKSVARLDNPANKLAELHERYPMMKLSLGMVAGCMQSIGKQKDDSYSALVQGILNRVSLKPEETSKALLIVIRAADSLRKARRMTEQTRTQLSEMLTCFNESDRLREPFQAVIRTSGIDIDQLQLSLEMVVESHAPQKAIEDVEMVEAADVDQREKEFTADIETIHEQIVKEASFLEGPPTPLFGQLARAFTHAFDVESRVSRFLALPILKHDAALQEPIFISFFVRFFCGPYPASARAAAIKTVVNTISKGTERFADLQALLPYIMAVLADPSEKVRREAANLLAIFERSSSKFKHDNGNESHQPWASNTLYGKNELSKTIKWLPAKEVYKITHRALLTALEEYVLDAAQIEAVLETALRGSTDSVTKKPPTDFELKKSLRTDFFTFLCSHIANTPIFTVKLRLLNIVNRVAKVGSTTRTQELLPFFNEWRRLEEDEVVRIASNEKLDISSLDLQILGIVSPKDKNSAEILISSVTSQPKPPRSAFVAAVFNRLKETWSSLKDEHEVAVADALLELSLGAKPGDAELKNSCKDLLRSVDLSGSVLSSFISKVSVSAAEVDTQSPATKRRRTSQNRMVALGVREPEELDRLMEKLTFILELVDGSAPENYPQLLGGLFQILTALHQLKMQVQSEMSYLLSLVLGIMLAIVNKAKGSPKYKLDTSSIRADLIIDCIRGSENPQVQNTALLMIAGLAVIAPELVLHSIMPIFTFMGSNVLKKDDEYSALVIDQTIDQVVPPLIQSLRTQKRDVVSGTSELLLSFTAAFEHIPSHRRLRLFEALITKLGTADFLFAVYAMLANRYAMNKDVLSLMTSLAANLSAEIQLQTYIRYLSLVRDALQPKPGLSRTLLGVGDDDGREPQSVAADLLQALAHLLGQAPLAAKMSKSFELADSEPESQISTLFSNILEQTLHLADNIKGIKPLSKACGDVLGSLLGTLSLIDFLDTIEVLLQRQNDDLRRKVLRLLESRLEQGHERDSKTQERVLAFLSNLVDIIDNSSDVLLKHAAVACMERVADKYGRKDPAALAKAAKTVAGSHCIGLTDNRLRVMGVLCLASMTEVLGQAIIPILPDAVSRSSDLLKISMETGKEKPQLHDAVYSFISSLLVHVPFMVSDNYLDSILQLSFKSSNADIPEDSEENRREALQLLAQRVEVDEIFNAVERNWDWAVAEGPRATRELLNITGVAIAKHPKSATVRNVSVLMKLLYKAFDIRRTQLTATSESRYDASNIESVESDVNDVAIKMVYKLNDTLFRPLFIQLTDWATKELAGKDAVGLKMRLTTFYKFLTTFFGTLKSIVTGYSTYIIESVVDALKTVKPVDSGLKSLWLAIMSMLRNSFEHDRDEFWQSPSHLTAISGPLISQLSYATNASTSKLIAAEVIPVIVELAVASDSPDNYKELNTAIMKFFRVGNSTTGATGGENPYTRLVAVKCEQSLTERLGEEWLALLPEMLPYISELMEDEDENVEKEVRKWILAIEEVLGEKLDDMLM